MTAGSRYLKRLNDGRSVWLNGGLVSDVTGHPAFRGTVRSVAAIMDLQDDPRLGPQLTYITEDTGARANLAFLPPAEKEDVFRRGKAFRIWSDAAFGVMSRVGGFYRSQLTGWYVDRERLRHDTPQFPEKLARYYTGVRDGDLLLTAAGHDPQIDRTKLANELGDAYTALRAVKETEDGVVVRGSKMIATGAPYMDQIMVSPHSPKTAAERDYALMFAVSPAHDGVHLICREPFAAEGTEDHPLSSRFDEMDAVLVFDDALIPWENVFIYRDPDAIWKLRSNPFSHAVSLHENVARLASKLEFVAAVATELAKSIGIVKFAHVQEKLAELYFQTESVEALLLSAEHRSVSYPPGVWAPDLQPMVTAKNLGNRYYPRALEIIQQLSGAGMLQAPSVLAELNGPLRHHLRHAYRGADRDAPERVRLLKLAWDLTGSGLGARHELYERFYAGDPERTYAAQYAEYDKQSLIEKVQRRTELYSVSEE